MNKKDFEKKLNALPEVAPDVEDTAAIKRIAKSKGGTVISHSQLESDIEYSGKISLRVPKSLHRDLIIGAKGEGVSLNQYLLYKLSN